METNKCQLSIVIPVFNGSNEINICLDSIYSQGMSPEQFEVICVDDCSSDSTVEVIEDYANRMQPGNLKIIRHNVNKRHGGGRNTGIEKAIGTYILFLDHDDYFKVGSLLQLVRIAEINTGVDIVMFDFEAFTNGIISQKSHYLHNDTKEMKGREFLQSQEIPWVPWCYLYRRDFLNEHCLRFEENIRFEDADFVMKCTILAQRMFFVPLIVVGHTYSDSQTTAVGNNVGKIIDLFRLSDRIKKIAMEEMLVDKECSNAILAHHLFRHKYDIMRYLWRIPFSQMVYILRHYRAYVPNNNKWLTFSARYPLIFAIVLQLLKPLFPLMRKIYLSSK